MLQPIKAHKNSKMRVVFMANGFEELPFRKTGSALCAQAARMDSREDLVVRWHAPFENQFPFWNSERQSKFEPGTYFHTNRSIITQRSRTRITTRLQVLCFELLPGKVTKNRMCAAYRLSALRLEFHTLVRYEIRRTSATLLLNMSRYPTPFDIPVFLLFRGFIEACYINWLL